MLRRSRKFRNRRHGHATPAEVLEQRALLSADVVVNWNDGIVTVEGTDGDDVIAINRIGDQITFDGAQFVYPDNHTSLPASYVDTVGWFQSFTIRGAGGNDIIVNNTNIPMKMFGDDGNDWIIGGDSDDELYGGNHDDFIDGGYGDDVILGNDGLDNLHGGRGFDTVYGGVDGFQDIVRGDSIDILYDSNGEDVTGDGAARADNGLYTGEQLGFGITKKAGKVWIEGTSSGDTIIVAKSDNRLLIPGWGYLYPTSDLEYVDISGMDGDDIIVNTLPVDSFIHGNRGNDRLVGGRLRDVLFGDEGNDSLAGGWGSDTTVQDENVSVGVSPAVVRIEGTGESDRIRVEQQADSLNVYMGRVADGPSGERRIASVDLNHLQTSRIYINGHGLNDEILLGGVRISAEVHGNDGDDYIWSGDYSDQLYGDAGNDIIFGMDGDDEIDGGEGEDIVDGGDDTDWAVNSEHVTNVEPRLIYDLKVPDFAVVENRVDVGWINGADEFVVGDFDGDGRDDILSRQIESGSNRILFARGNERFSEETNLIPEGWINGFDEVVAGDFDGDGRDDLFFREIDSGANRILFARGDLSFTEVTNRVVPDWINGFDEYLTGDFDGDGRDDVLFREVDSGWNRILFSRGQEQFVPITNRIPNGWINGFDEFIAGDFDGDNRADVLFREVESGSNRILFSRGNEQFVEVTQRIETGWINGFDEVATGDFDGDGRDDIFFREIVSGANRILMSYGNEQFREVTDIVGDGDINGYDKFIAGKFDADNQTDLFFREVEAGSNRIAFARGPVHLKRIDTHDASYELRIATGSAFGTLHVSGGAAVGALEQVHDFQIANGQVQAQRSDLSWETITLNGPLQPRLENAQPADPVSNQVRQIVGNTATNNDLNRTYVNTNGRAAATTLLDAVGLIRTPGGGIGTGVVLNRGGNQFVLTADHVVAGVPAGNIRFQGIRVNAVVARSADFGGRDLALLQLRGPLPGIIGAELPDFQIMREGIPILTAGFGFVESGSIGRQNFGFSTVDDVHSGSIRVSNPANGTSTHYAGPFAKYRYDEHLQEAAIAPGDSGGPDIIPLRTVDAAGNVLWVPVLGAIHSWGNSTRDLDGDGVADAVADGDWTGSTIIDTSVISTLRRLTPDFPQPTISLDRIRVFKDGDGALGGAGEWNLFVEVNGVKQSLGEFKFHDNILISANGYSLDRIIHVGEWTNQGRLTFSGYEADSGLFNADDKINTWSLEFTLPPRILNGTRLQISSGIQDSGDTSYELFVSVTRGGTLFNSLSGRSPGPLVSVEVVDRTLSINGTDNADQIVISEDDGRIQVTGSTATYDVADLSMISVFSGAGDDQIINLSSIPMIAEGGSGADFLSGGYADFLSGGEGNDTVANGRELFIQETAGVLVINGSSEREIISRVSYGEKDDGFKISTEFGTIEYETQEIDTLFVSGFDLNDELNFGGLNGDQLKVIIDDAPTLTANQSLGVNGLPQISWNPVAHAVEYQVRLRGPNRTTELFSVDAHSSSFNVVDGTPQLPGRYNMQVRAVGANGRATSWSDSRHSILKPAAATVSLSTEDQSTDLTISWDHVVGADYYDVWVNNQSTGQAQIVREKNVTGTQLVLSDLPIGRYAVWVRAFSSDAVPGVWKGQSINVRPQPVTTSLDRSTFAPRPKFTWGPVPGAISYDIYIRRAFPNTVAQLIRDQNVDGTSFTPTEDLPYGKYTWWVRANGEGGFKSAWSSATSFFTKGRTTADFSNAADTETPRIVWDRVDGARHYEVWLEERSTRRKVVHQNGLLANELEISDTMASGKYRFWVRAISDDGAKGLWSKAVQIEIS